ncbi:unnamed protein product [Ixodes pacificus]
MLNWNSMTLGRNVARPDTSMPSPSVAPAKLRNTNVGLVMSILKDAGKSLALAPKPDCTASLFCSFWCISDFFCA